MTSTRRNEEEADDGAGDASPNAHGDFADRAGPDDEAEAALSRMAALPKGDRVFLPRKCRFQRRNVPAAVFLPLPPTVSTLPGPSLGRFRPKPAAHCPGARSWPGLRRAAGQAVPRHGISYGPFPPGWLNRDAARPSRRAADRRPFLAAEPMPCTGMAGRFPSPMEFLPTVWPYSREPTAAAGPVNRRLPLRNSREGAAVSFSPGG